MRFGFDSSWSRAGSAAEAAFARSFVLVSAAAIAFGSSGCVVFRHKGPTAEGVTASREFSRQGVAAMEAGEWQHAEELLRKALQISPDDASTHRSMSEVLWHRGAREEAIAQIDQAIEHDANNSSLSVRAGEMDLAAGATDAALTHAERAIRSDPRSATAWALRGRCFMQKNEGDRALADLQHSLEYVPDNPDALLDVATIYRQRGQSARSLTTVHHLLDTYPPGEESQQALTLEGMALLDLKRPQQACEVFTLASKKGTPTADCLYNLAQAYAAAGDMEQATATAQRALTLNASHQPSRELLAQLAARNTAGNIQRR